MNVRGSHVDFPSSADSRLSLFHATGFIYRVLFYRRSLPRDDFYEIDREGGREGEREDSFVFSRFNRHKSERRSVVRALVHARMRKI